VGFRNRNQKLFSELSYARNYPIGMRFMQTSQLQYDKKQKKYSRQAGTKEILSLVPESYRAQGGQIASIVPSSRCVYRDCRDDPTMQ